MAGSMSKFKTYRDSSSGFILSFLSPAENTRVRSDAFAAKNGLPKFEYVLHPRTTGFIFIVDRLRKGQTWTTPSFCNHQKFTLKQDNELLVINPVFIRFDRERVSVTEPVLIIEMFYQIYPVRTTPPRILCFPMS